MENTRLIKLLKTFSKPEIRELSDYVNSPFYNKNKNVVSLFEQLSNHYPDFNAKSFTEEKVFRKMFKGEKFDYFKLKNIISDLYRLSMDYLKLKFPGNKLENEIFFLIELRQRNLLSHYESEYKKVVKAVTDTPVKDELYFFDEYRISAEKGYYNFVLKPNTGFNILQEQFDSFCLFTIITLLKFYTLMLHEMNQNNVKYDMKLMEEIKSYLLKNEEETNPTFLIYKNILLLELSHTEEYYFKVKELQEKYGAGLSVKDKYMTFTHRAGFCAFVYNRLGKKTFIQEILEVHKGMLKEGLYEYYKMSYPDFVNFVKIGTLAGDYEYVISFIEKYKDRIIEEERENCLNFTAAYMAFHKNDKQKAMELLSRTNFSNFILKIQVKLLQIEIYAELGLYEQLLSAIDTCRHYLRSEGFLTELYRKSISDFLILVKDIATLKEDDEWVKDGYKRKEISKKVEELPSNIFGIKLWLEDFLQV